MKLSKNLYEVFFVGKLFVEAMNKEEAENMAKAMIDKFCPMNRIHKVADA